MPLTQCLRCCHVQGTSRLRASSSSHPFAGSTAASPRAHGGSGGSQVLSAEELDGQVVYELGQSGEHAVPLSAGIGAKRSLGDEIEATGQHVPADLGDGADPTSGAGGGFGWGWGAAGAGGAPGGEAAAAGIVYGNSGAAVDGMHSTGGAGGAAGGGEAGSGFTTAGLQHIAAKLRNGSMTPARAAAPPGDGRYASYEGSVESSRQGAAPGSLGVAAAASGAGGRVSGTLRQAAGGTRGRPTPLHISRVSVADLLQGSGGEAGSEPQPGEAPQLHTMSRQAQASISRLAASMHGGGMQGVTPNDIRTALSGARTSHPCQRSYCWPACPFRPPARPTAAASCRRCTHAVGPAAHPPLPAPCCVVWCRRAGRRRAGVCPAGCGRGVYRYHRAYMEPWSGTEPGGGWPVCHTRGLLAAPGPSRGRVSQPGLAGVDGRRRRSRRLLGGGLRLSAGSRGEGFAAGRTRRGSRAASPAA